MTNYSSRSDRDLVLACQRREPVAFEELVKRYQKSVYCLLYQLAPDWPDIIDLSQNVFIRVWRSINNLRNPASFRSWLTKQVVNLFYDEWQLRMQNTAVPTFVAWESADSTDTIKEFGALDDNQLNNDDPVLLMAQAMKKLPEELRTPLVLKELESLNYEEIAILTKTEVGTVKSRIAKARTQLQTMLGSHLKANVELVEVVSQ